MSVNIGDDVTINGVIVEILPSSLVWVRLKDGHDICVNPSVFNTIRPRMEVSKVVERTLSERR